MRVNLLAGEEARLGIGGVGQKQMTPQQFMDLYFLHELGHNFGADHDKPGFPTTAEYQKSIWENCFK
jgi:hypothetical protein